MFASKPELTAHVQIVLGAVAIGEYRAADLFDGQQLPTLAGAPLTVGVTPEGSITVSARNSIATIVRADIEVCGGVVQIIDTLLAPAGPPDSSLPPSSDDCPHGTGYIGAHCCPGSGAQHDPCPHGGTCDHKSNECVEETERTVCTSGGACEPCGGPKQPICVCTRPDCNSAVNVIQSCFVALTPPTALLRAGYSTCSTCMT